MKTPTIALFDAKPHDNETFNEQNREFNFKMKYYEHKLTADTVALAKGAEVVCAFVNDQLSSEVIQSLKTQGTQLIAMRCAGYNNIDLEAAYGQIHVVRVPAYSPHSVAEHTLALILALNRKTHRAYSRTRDNNFTLNGLLGFDMAGKTVGVIGTGKIGRTLIKILNGLSMKVIAYDAFANPEWAASDHFEYCDLETLYKQSDIISLHCPLTAETRHLIDDSSIAQMKPGVMIINTGRGALIHSHALIEGLKSGKIGAAGLDVYEEEGDYFFEDYSDRIIADDTLARLLSFNNVLVTAHQAFFTKEALAEISKTTLQNIQTYFAEKNLPNEICYHCGKIPCSKKIKGQCF